MRTFDWADVEPMAALMLALDAGPEPAAADAVDRLERWLRQPNLRPERDCYLAFTGSHGGPKAAGYVLLAAEELISRGVLMGGVVPSHRRRGIGRALLRWAADHALTLGLHVLHVDVPEDAQPAQRLLGSEGFTHVRTHWHLGRESMNRIEVSLPPGTKLRPMTHADVPALTDLQNAAFTGSWGYSPNTPQEIEYRVFEMTPQQPDDVVLLERDGRLLAYCWGQHGAEGEPGVVGMVGVEPTLQGQGLGRVATAASMNLLMDAGARPLHITVDAENTPAVRLYQNLGFTLEWRSFWYERRLT